MTNGVDFFRKIINDFQNIW